MSFWDVFVACLTGAGAMSLALGVVALVGWGLFLGGQSALTWISDALGNRARR